MCQKHFFPARSRNHPFVDNHLSTVRPGFFLKWEGRADCNCYQGRPESGKRRPCLFQPQHKGNQRPTQYNPKTVPLDYMLRVRDIYEPIQRSELLLPEVFLHKAIAKHVRIVWLRISDSGLYSIHQVPIRRQVIGFVLRVRWKDRYFAW